ncbi:HTTM domain-containing protein [Stieleria sp. TO1_6]|uniref:HTTM domain-containing protein n=1 Tax=Stieleria tagensis TaxID=2956795 RepID=UPI00209B4436|nr:HTTM domain-containing protein [Stieleria tagensis]MCO8120845.1 HTTM domain-containing protein [Stieleria tagensis]
MRPHTLCVLRILAGAMLLYCHLVLATDLSAFVGADAWINNDMARQLHDGAFGVSDWARSYLWYFNHPTSVVIHHGFTLAVTAMFMIGYATRITAPLALLLQLMYLHRLTGALFGLDQIVTYATMYLALTPCGSCFSVDAKLARRWADKRKASAFWRFMLPDDSPSVAATIGTRLLQLHLCVIYLFGGLAKSRGVTWWDGTAVWYAVANYEYQSLDMTWMARYPAIISALSNATLFWEVFYCALVWPRITRPFVLAVAVGVHASIALFLGMATFGLMMIFANGIFLAPAWFQSRQQRLLDQTEPTLSDPDPEADQDALDHQKLRDRRDKVGQAASRVKRRYRALKKREEKYEQRVAQLREQEDKIKRIVRKRRERNGSGERDGD